VPGHYERLSSLDASFLALESRTTHMHVAGIALFDAEPLRTPDGGIDIRRIRRFVESRLGLIPRYRQRLGRVPFERHPVWVDDEHFNLAYHVRHTSLPRPGSIGQLEALTARLVSRQLDRAKPLWEFTVVEGVEGDRFAIASKIHHCMIDGIAGVDLMAVMLDLAPQGEIEAPAPFRPRPEPSGAELVLRETARRAGRLVATARNVRGAAQDVRAVAFEGVRRVRAVAHSLGSGWLTTAPRTPFNGKVSPNRRFRVLDTDLDQVKEIKNALGGSVNDVILATVAGAVRAFLGEHRGFPTEGVPFRVMAPVSVRSADQRGSMGNHVAMWLVRLPVDESDPVRRLAQVSEETLKLKQTDQALGASTLVQLSVGAPATLVSLASRLATGARPFNMTVTNVPGPQFPLYLLEARMLASYPLVPLWESHGVGIALFSYDGSVGWGFNGDWDLMPDLDAFVAAVEASFAELLAAARSRDRSDARSGTKPKKRPPLGTPPSAGGPARSAGKSSGAG
jgi:WS/DGAT/MGAT family acyltransferase